MSDTLQPGTDQDSTAGGGILWILPTMVAFAALILGMILWQVSSSSTADAAPPGLSQFRLAGCASCHGTNGEGGTGPAMAGHRSEQVIRQVRAPLGTMPLFTIAELDDEKLELIVDWVVALEGSAGTDGHDHGHGDPSELDTREVLTGHHWMGLSAMLAGDVDEARHHIDHATELVRGEHRVAMLDVIEMLDAGKLEQAEQSVKDMLAESSPAVGSLDELHVKLALQALAVGDAEEAIEHLERVGPGSLAEPAGSALVALRQGDGDLAASILTAAIEPHDDTGTAPHDDGEALHDDTEEPHHDDAEPHDDAGTEPHDDGEAPHDDGEAPHDDGEAPHDDGEAPHDDTGTEPHDDDAEPHDDTGTEPHDDGEAPHDDTEEPSNTEPAHDDTGTAPHDH